MLTEVNKLVAFLNSDLRLGLDDRDVSARASRNGQLTLRLSSTGPGVLTGVGREGIGRAGMHEDGCQTHSLRKPQKHAALV